jgi:hypothetical protein
MPDLLLVLHEELYARIRRAAERRDLAPGEWAVIALADCVDASEESQTASERARTQGGGS